MRNLVWTITFLFCATLTAQDAYETGMQKAFDLWEANETIAASQLFERISRVEKENWLPSFYVATIEIIGSFGIKEEAKLKAKLTKAQTFLDEAKTLSENNPEILITQAMLNTAYIAFDGQKYGMTLSAKNNRLYEKALRLAPNNPRVVLGSAEWEMGTAEFFQQSIAKSCEKVNRAVVLFADDSPAKFHPSWGEERAQTILKKCKMQ
ncbi:hypothetical protein [Tenacibaculum sp. SG-28]|uniref:hypothetical protein n=1 Tax=Tenacibaculum sp. SG-28 TaxID=754426 RepID=UPI000CF423CF|nr:hypothetical protein [Tenacibaculum sp. SG-28]PQJ20715.1 hypothetical protein BSU00_10500 [Tenacibaculum sp. SG-28]